MVPLVSVEFTTDIEEVDAPSPLRREFMSDALLGDFHSITHRAKTRDWTSVKCDDREIILNFADG
jgi:hypothetical protein